MKIRTLFALLLPLPVIAEGVNQVRNNWAFGTEVQAYPAGFIPGIRMKFAPDAMQNFNMRLGYNVARRQDFGKHDTEQGGGWGGGIGYRRYGFQSLTPFFAGLRIDWWELTIDWRNGSTGLTNQNLNAVQSTGSTRISVLQPTLEIGYDWAFAASWSLSAALALGAEINVKTSGDAVGEGAILLFGIALQRSFAAK